MRVSIHWLRQFVDIPESSEELAEILTMLGFEAEITTYDWENNSIVSAKVLNCKSHPNADKLKLCLIDDGEGKKQVVCGAPNIDSGQTVAYARVGTIFSNDFKIKKIKIRGTESEGMICSERELGISDEHEGILLLDDSNGPGKKLSDCISSYLKTIDLDITPNRPDTMSHLGIAREISAKCNRKLKYNSLIKPKINPKYSIDIKLDNKKGCPRYIAGIMENIKLTKSPDWMVESLSSAGMRTINNLVDISNYVLLEMGHPTHIFDLKHFPESTIRVRNAKTGEKLTTLDGENCILTPDHLLITNGRDPVALAGIMGGEKSAVSDETHSILIESAYFDPITVRRGAKALGMITEASKRFERGADPNGCVTAFWRIVELVQELCGGKLVSEMTDKYSHKISRKTIILDPQFIDQSAGIKIPKEFTEKVLKKLEIKSEVNENKKWNCIVPTFRPDLTREIDILEEIIRMYGYDKIPSKNSYTGLLKEKFVDPHLGLKSIQNILTGLGYSQCYSNSLQSSDIANCNGNAIKMLNPHSEKMTHLRTSLIPGLINILNRNKKVDRNDIQLFEIGGVHFKNIKNNVEEMLISGVVTGHSNTDSIHPNISVVEHSFFSIKGHIEALMQMIFNGKFQAIQDNDNLFTPGFTITAKGNTIGKFGMIKTDFLNNSTKIDAKEVFGFELFTKYLLKSLNKKKKFNPISKFPKIERELNFVVSNTLDTDKISSIIKKSGKGLIKYIKPVNLYKHESLGIDKKSIVFKMIFQSESKTLEDKDVNSIVDHIISKISSTFKAELRI